MPPNGNPITSDEWKALVIRAKVSLTRWQDGLSERLKDMEKWLDKRYEPLTEDQLEELMKPKVIIDENWTEEDERQLQKAWQEHPTRLYVLEKTEEKNGYSLIAQSCKLITRMYRYPPQRIISRENGFLFEGRDSAAMSSTFCMQLAKVALHPFFKYRVPNLVTAIGWCVIARTNDRGPWGFSGYITGDIYMKNLADKFEPARPNTFPDAWLDCKVTVRRDLDQRWKENWGTTIRKQSMGGKIAALGNTELVQSDWARLLGRIEDLAGFDPEAAPTERGSGPLVVTNDDLNTLERALELVSGFDQVSGLWDANTWFLVMKEVLNITNTAPASDGMRDLVLTTELHNLRMKRYFEKNPQWPAYEAMLADRARAAAGDVDAEARLARDAEVPAEEDPAEVDPAEVVEEDDWFGFSDDDEEEGEEEEGEDGVDDDDDDMLDHEDFNEASPILGGDSDSEREPAPAGPTAGTQKRCRQDKPLNQPKKRRVQSQKPVTGDSASPGIAPVSAKMMEIRSRRSLEDTIPASPQPASSDPVPSGVTRPDVLPTPNVDLPVSSGVTGADVWPTPNVDPVPSGNTSSDVWPTPNLDPVPSGPTRPPTEAGTKLPGVWKPFRSLGAGPMDERFLPYLRRDKYTWIPFSEMDRMSREREGNAQKAADEQPAREQEAKA